jgi:hypothetical protein
MTAATQVAAITANQGSIAGTSMPSLKQHQNNISVGNRRGRRQDVQFSRVREHRRRRTLPPRCREGSAQPAGVLVRAQPGGVGADRVCTPLVTAG